MRVPIARLLALVDGDLPRAELLVAAAYARAHDLPALPSLGSVREAERAEPSTVDRILVLLDGFLDDLHQLVTVYELLIPDRDRTLNGAFFTPEPIADFIAGRALPDEPGPWVDPACGCGAILIATSRAAARAWGWPLHRVVYETLHGVDLEEYNIRRARLLLSLLLAHDGHDLDVERLRLTAANSLGADWSTLLPTPAGGFSAVVGNPPYVRFQHLTEEVRGDLRAWETIGQGNYNLYYAFFELGHELLGADGRMAYIVPNGFFGVAAAAPLRRWLSETRTLVEIVDFGHERVFEASVYTCITTLAKRPGDALVYHRAADAGSLGRITDPREGGADGTRGSTGTRIPHDDLDERPWNLYDPRAAQAVAVATADHLLPLSAIVDVRGGVATLRDRLYLVDEADDLVKRWEGREYPIERGITRPLLRVSDVASSAMLPERLRRIVYPYALDGGGRPIALDEERLMDDYPGAYAYLLAIADELARRDHGTKEYERWFAYGRSQGLLPMPPALYCPVYAKTPRFVHDPHGGLLFVNGLGVTLRDDAPEGLTLTLLEALLHGSPVLAAYMAARANHIAGGYAHYKRALLLDFRVPNLSDDEAATILAASGAERSRLVERSYGRSFER